MGHKGVRRVARSTQQDLSSFLTVTHLKLEKEGNLRQSCLKIAQDVSLANVNAKWRAGTAGGV